MWCCRSGSLLRSGERKDNNNNKIKDKQSINQQKMFIMKNSIKLMLLCGAVAALTSACSKELAPTDGASGQEVNVTLTAALPGGALTKAVGDASTVNRCLLQVYYYDAKSGIGTAFGSVQTKTATAGTKEYSFDLRLVTGKQYAFVLWADTGDNGADKYYTTSNFEKITYKETYTGNSEERDAFYGVLTGYDPAKQSSASVTLHRPFAQLNVSTTDWDIVPDANKPAKVKVAFKDFPTGLNAVTGAVVTSTTTAEYTAAILTEAAASGVKALTCDYIFAGEDEASLSDFTMSFLDNAGTTAVASDYVFTNIPIRRNYRTNVSGNLLTVAGKLNVVVDPNFNNPDYSVDPTKVTVSGMDGVKGALSVQTVDEVTVTTANESEATIDIPKYTASGKEITLNFPALTNKLTLQYESNSQNANAPSVVNIFCPSSSDLVINLPESTVYLNGTTYSNVNSSTSNNTLVIGKGVTVSSLTVTKGNVRVKAQGTVSAIAKGTDAEALTYLIVESGANVPSDAVSGVTELDADTYDASAEAYNLQQEFTNTTASTSSTDVPTYKLNSDIDIQSTGGLVVEAGKSLILDLNGHTITANNSFAVSTTFTGGNIMSYGTLTIIDSSCPEGSTVGSGKIVADKDYSSKQYSTSLVVAANGGTVNLQSGYIYAVRNDPYNCGQFGVGLCKGGTFTMTGGKIEAGWYAVSGNGSGNDGTTINIQGGELISTKDYAVFLPMNGTTTISGGTINGAAGAVAMRNGTLTIENGTISSNPSNGYTGTWGSGTGNMKNACVNIMPNYGNITVSITGGTFETATTEIFDATQTYTKKDSTTYTATVSVTGGTFPEGTSLPSWFTTSNSEE